MPTKKNTPATATQDLSVFNLDVSPALLAQAIYVYQENLHRGMSKVKTRGEINRTHKKVYKQKGTGNARHGSRSANVYVGGGVVFGPVGYKTKPIALNQKMKLRALAGMLTLYQKENRLSLFDTVSQKDISTKSLSAALAHDDKVSLSLIHSNESPEFMKSVSNISDLNLYTAQRLNAYKVASTSKIVITPNALVDLTKRLESVLSKKAK